MALPMIIPILLWSAYIGVFPYRSFAYMGISVLIYLTYMAILWYYNNKSPIRQESKNMAIKLKRHKGLTIKRRATPVLKVGYESSMAEYHTLRLD